MTIEDRGLRVAAFIEGTPAAVTYRSESLAALILGLEDTSVAAAIDAADATIAAHPEVLRDVTRIGLATYIGSQVHGLATGDLAEIELRPALD